MKILDRLIVKELLGPFITGVVLFMMLVFTAGYLPQATNLALQGVPPLLVAKFVVFALPATLTLTFPIAMLVAALTGFGRLSSDSEAVAMLSAGISFPRMARFVFVMGALVSLAAFLWNETIVPPATRAMWDLKMSAIQHIAKSDEPLAYSIPGKDGQSIEETVKVQGGYDASKQVLRNVTIVKYADHPPWNGGVQLVVHCREAHENGSAGLDQNGLNWLYHNVTVTLFAQDSNSHRMFANTSYWQSLSVLPQGAAVGKSFNEILNTQVNDPSRLSFLQLQHEIEHERMQGRLLEARGNEVNLYGKLSLPLASLIFGVMGAALGLNTQRGGGKARGYGNAILIVFLYWMLYNSMFLVGKNGTLPPILASFLADILGALVGAGLVWRASH